MNLLDTLTADEREQVDIIIEFALDQNIPNYTALKSVLSDKPKKLLKVASWLLFESAFTVNPVTGERLHDNSSQSASSSLTQEPGIKPKHQSVGAVIDDFRIIKALGEGSYARVYLANQISLGRKVALKISVYHGQEARNLARLEHPGIVQVYSQHILSQQSLNLICMQYVPGMSLQALYKKLLENDIERLSAKSIEECFFSKRSSSFDKSNQTSDEWSYLSVIVGMTCSLAEAFEYAHARGVLHLDIKPGNVLMTSDLRAFVVDFNISLAAGSDIFDAQTFLGGTLKYTSPEQKVALRDPTGAKFADVDERSDIFSLGRILKEFCGLADHIPLPLQFCMEKATSEKQVDRYQSMKDFAGSLATARKVVDAQEMLKPESRLTKLARYRPLLILGLGCLIPQMIGSAFNISYNVIAIISQLTEPQIAAFQEVAALYNLILYPAALLIFLRPLRSFTKMFVQSKESLSEEKSSKLRKKLLEIPIWLAIASSIGWLPGVFVFAGGIDYLVGDVSNHIYVHFVISCFLSWLLALAYSLLFLSHYLTRSFVPYILSCDSSLERDLRKLKFRLLNRIAIAKALVTVIPILGVVVAILSVGKVGVQSFEFGFQALTLILIGIGGVGVYVAGRVDRAVKKVLKVLSS